MNTKENFARQKAVIKAAESLNALNGMIEKAIEQNEATAQKKAVFDNVVLVALMQLKIEIYRTESNIKKLSK